MANCGKCPELKLSGNVAENFKNFEVRFNDYCIQANYRDLTKDPSDPVQLTEYYAKPLLELSALRSAVPDETLQVIRYTIDPQMTDADKKKPWVLMAKLKQHYTGSHASSVMSDRFQFWNMTQNNAEPIQDWEVRIRQASSLCQYGEATDELSRDKFVFGLNNDLMRTELLKQHRKPDGADKSLSDVVSEARAMETAVQTNKIISDAKGSTASCSIEEQVHFTSTGTRMAHKDMKLRRAPGTCHWCGDKRGPHPWRSCPANGKPCSKCGRLDHFAKVCLMDPIATKPRPSYTKRTMEPNTRRQSVHELNTEDAEDKLVCYVLDAVFHVGEKLGPKPGKNTLLPYPCLRLGPDSPTCASS